MTRPLNFALLILGILVANSAVSIAQETKSLFGESANLSSALPPGEWSRVEESVVSFRQACLTQFSGLGTLVGFLFEEDNHGWTKAWRHSEGSGTWAGSV